MQGTSLVVLIHHTSHYILNCFICIALKLVKTKYFQHYALQMCGSYSASFAWSRICCHYTLPSILLLFAFKPRLLPGAVLFVKNWKINITWMGIFPILVDLGYSCYLGFLTSRNLFRWKLNTLKSKGILIQHALSCHPLLDQSKISLFFSREWAAGLPEVPNSVKLSLQYHR